MASTYQLVPYMLQVHLFHKPTETRAVDADLTGGDVTLKLLIAWVLDGLRSRVLTSATSPDRRLRLSRLRVGERVILAEFEPGRSGLNSSIERDGHGVVFTRTEGDTEYVPLRYLFYFPPGSHAALLLAEKAGVTGGVTMVSEYLRKNLHAAYQELRLRLNPAVTGEVMKAITRDRPVKALVFTRPNANDPRGRVMHVAGQVSTLEIRIKAPRRKAWTWKALAGQNQEVSREGLLGILAEQLGHPDDMAAMVEAGWDVATEVTFKNGTSRTVNVDSNSAVTMSFPSWPDGVPGEGRPDDDQFGEACGSTLGLFEGQYGLTADAAAHCRWGDAEWVRPAELDPWKVVWDEPRASPPDPARPGNN